MFNISFNVTPSHIREFKNLYIATQTDYQKDTTTDKVIDLLTAVVSNVGPVVAPFLVSSMIQSSTKRDEKEAEINKEFEEIKKRIHLRNQASSKGSSLKVEMTDGPTGTVDLSSLLDEESEGTGPEGPKDSSTSSSSSTSTESPINNIIGMFGKLIEGFAEKKTTEKKVDEKEVTDEKKTTDEKKESNGKEEDLSPEDEQLLNKKLCDSDDIDCECKEAKLDGVTQVVTSVFKAISKIDPESSQKSLDVVKSFCPIPDCDSCKVLDGMLKEVKEEVVSYEEKPKPLSDILNQ